MPLRPNIGGDINLTQLASGAGVLDTTYQAHAERRGYHPRPGSQVTSRQADIDTKLREKRKNRRRSFHRFIPDADPARGTSPP